MVPPQEAVAGLASPLFFFVPETFQTEIW